MTRGADSSSSAAKRAKVDKEDPLVRRRNELIREIANARVAVAVKAEGNKALREATESLMQNLRSVCTDFEAKNEKLLGRLPFELWEKIVDEYLDQNDLFALAMTCRFFRDTTKGLGKKLESNLNLECLFELRKSGRMPSHSLAWFQWVCDTLTVLPGFNKGEGAVSENDLLLYAAVEGSVEIFRWLVEKKGCELNLGIGFWAGTGGSVEILKYVRGKGDEFNQGACHGAAGEGHLEALKWLRAQDPPCPWNERTCADVAYGGHLEILKWARSQDPPCPWDKQTCYWAAYGGHLDVLEWARSQDPPCPWNVGTCFHAAAQGGHLDVLKWSRSQTLPCPWDYRTCTEAAKGGHLEALKFLRSQNPPCPWSRGDCRHHASWNGHEHVVDWIDQQED